MNLLVHLGMLFVCSNIIAVTCCASSETVFFM